MSTLAGALRPARPRREGGPRPPWPGRQPRRRTTPCASRARRPIPRRARPPPRRPRTALLRAGPRPLHNARHDRGRRPRRPGSTHSGSRSLRDPRPRPPPTARAWSRAPQRPATPRAGSCSPTAAIEHSVSRRRARRRAHRARRWRRRARSARRCRRSTSPDRAGSTPQEDPEGYARRLPQTPRARSPGSSSRVTRARQMASRGCQPPARPTATVRPLRLPSAYPAAFA